MSQPPPDLPPPEEPPGPPGQPPIGPIPPESPGIPPLPPAPPEGPPGATDRHPEPSPVGGHVAAGVGLGLLGLVAGLIVAFSGVNLGTVGFPAWITTLTGFSLVTAVGVVLTVLRRTRRTGAGYLIVVAASWIVIIGPCVTLQYAFHA